MPWHGEPHHDTCEGGLRHSFWEVMSGFRDSSVMSFLSEIVFKYGYNGLFFFLKLPHMVLTCRNSYIHVKIV